MFKDKLKELRKNRGLTQNDVAEFVGVKQNSYNSWENGKREPNFSKLQKLAKYFNVSTDYLLDSEKQFYFSLKNILELLPERQYSVDVSVYFSESLSEDNQKILPRSKTIFESCRWGDKEEYFLDLSNLKNDIISQTQEWHTYGVIFIDSGCHNYEENCLVIVINPR
jgi:transcriptional regulator with XRE-family HTH domain